MLRSHRRQPETHMVTLTHGQARRPLGQPPTAMCMVALALTLMLSIDVARYAVHGVKFNGDTNAPGTAGHTIQNYPLTVSIYVVLINSWYDTGYNMVFVLER